MKLGVQLYNFRDQLADDFTGTLQRIADLGFEGVEFVGYSGPMPPEALAEFLRDLNLECAGCMYKSDYLLDAENPVYDYVRALRSPAVTVSTSCDDYPQQWPQFAELFGKLGKAAAANNTVFSYHNHWKECEIADGVPALLRMLDANDPAEVFAEPDICWLTKGGVDPAEFINRYAGRIRQVHFKDITDLSDYNTTAALGRGVVKLEEAFEAALAAGVQWVIYEQDYCSDPFECANESLLFLRELQSRFQK